MGKFSSGPEFEEIAALVREEKDAALAAFRRGDFQSRVMGRWPNGGRRTAGPKIRSAVVVAAAVAVLVMAAAFFFLVRQTAVPGRRPGFQMLASALSALPGGATLSREETMIPAVPDLPGSSALAEFLRSVLAAAQGTARETGAPGSQSGGAAPAGRTTLYRKMEILFKDRVIERTLLSLKDPSKEV